MDVSNEVSGTVSGDVFQAGEMHFHFPAPVPDTPPPAPQDLPDVRLDPAAAKQAYEKACRLEQDWPERGVTDLPEIEGLLKLAAASGHADAMARLGLIAEGRTRATMAGERADQPTTTQVVAAERWYLHSAQHGSGFGALHLGRIEEEHHGNATQALRWYEKAANLGFGIAKARYDGLRKRLSLGLGALAGRKPMSTAHPAFVRWLQDEWQGNESLALAYCLAELSRACGGEYGEWGTLTEQEQMTLLQHFSALHPTEVELRAVAFEYQENIGDGNLRQAAARIAANPLSPANDFAPVWWQRKLEGRVSREQLTYTVELALDDFDQWHALLVELAERRTQNGTGPETALDLKLICREIADRRSKAVRALSGHDRWEFVLIFTPEQLDLLLHVNETCIGLPDEGDGFRQFWQRVDAALRAAPSESFP